MDPLSFIIALAAIIVSPWISYKIAKKQITANLVSANRQKWIDNFRNLVTTYLSTYSILTNEAVVHKSQKDLYNQYYLKMFNSISIFQLQLEFNSPYWSEFLELCHLINSEALTLLTKFDPKLDYFKNSRKLIELTHDIIQNEKKLISEGK